MKVRVGDRFLSLIELQAVGDVWEVSKHILGDRWLAFRLSDGTQADWFFGGDYPEHDQEWQYLGNFSKSTNLTTLYDILFV